MRPACLYGAVAGPAGGLDSGAAARAERVAGLYAGAAAGTIHQQRLPQDEVENDADAVEQEDGQQGPHDVAHAPAAGIAVDVSDQQGIAGQHQRNQNRHDKPHRHGHVVRLGQYDAQEQKEQQEHDTGGHPTTGRDHSLARNNGGHTILLSRRRREASTRAEAAPNTEEITAQTSHTRAAVSPATMRSVWPISRTKTSAKTAAAAAKRAPWRRSTSAATSMVVRASRYAGGWGAGNSASPAESSANSASSAAQAAHWCACSLTRRSSPASSRPAALRAS